MNANPAFFGFGEINTNADRRTASESPIRANKDWYPLVRKARSAVVNITNAKSAGALAALTKEVPKRQLIEEVRSVYKLPPPPTPSMQEAPIEQLTKRELEVLALMAEGKTDREIAGALSIAESTAKNHVSNILGKLNVPNRAGAVAAGYQLGLIGT